MIQPSPLLLTVAIVGLSLVDVWITVRRLKAGATEINPVGRAFFVRFGVLKGGLLLKAIGLAVILLCVWQWPQYWFVYAAYVFLLVGLLLWNFTEGGD